MLVYKWIEEIKLVEGYNRSCLYDLSRKTHYLVPKHFEDYIVRIEHTPLNSLTLDDEEKIWLDFIIENEFVILIPVNHFEYFSKLPLDWDSPSLILNAVIVQNPYNKLSLDFVDIGICKHLVFKCDSQKELELFLDENFSESNYQNLDVFINTLNLDKIEKLKEEFPIIGNVFFKNAVNQTEESKIENCFHFKDVDYTIVFNVNIQLFSESQKHNTYFNRKLYIGKDGEIKNAPECNNDFGNIGDIKSVEEFKNIVESKSFQKYWFIHKELIDVCMDCEFRHMCVDNRLPNQREDGTWYHKTECSYNPYISKWKGEKGYNTLKDINVIVNKKEYSRDENKIAKINKELWED